MPANSPGMSKPCDCAETLRAGFKPAPTFFASYALFAVKFFASLFGFFLIAALPHCALASPRNA